MARARLSSSSPARTRSIHLTRKCYMMKAIPSWRWMRTSNHHRTRRPRIERCLASRPRLHLWSTHLRSQSLHALSRIQRIDPNQFTENTRNRPWLAVWNAWFSLSTCLLGNVPRSGSEAAVKSLERIAFEDEVLLHSKMGGGCLRKV